MWPFQRVWYLKRDYTVYAQQHVAASPYKFNIFDFIIIYGLALKFFFKTY